VRQAQRRRDSFRALARALPDRDRLLGPARQRLDVVATRLPSALLRNARGHELRLRDLSRRLQARNPQVRLATSRERLNALGARLAGAQARRIERERERITRETQRTAALGLRLVAARDQRLVRERERLGHDRERLMGLSARTGRALVAMAGHKRASLARAASLLNALSYQATLDRGFAVVLDQSGRLVRMVAEATAGTVLAVRLSDGTIGAVSEGPAEAAPSSGAARSRSSTRKPPAPAGQRGLFD
jgi:exodeoxyribonuclease VII large subunit